MHACSSADMLHDLDYAAEILDSLLSVGWYRSQLRWGLAESMHLQCCRAPV